MDLKTAADSLLTNVYNTSSSGATTWTWDNSKKVLSTVVTYQSPQTAANIFSSTPPPTEKILYEFSVYRSLARQVGLGAINGDVTAKGVVKDAIQKMRTGFQNLLANSTLESLLTANGSIQEDGNFSAIPTSITITKADQSSLTLDLPTLWLKELIESGRTTLTVLTSH